MLTGDPRSVDVVAPVDPGLRRQMNASCFDRNDILVAVLVKIARFDRGHEVELLRFPRGHQLKVILNITSTKRENLERTI